MSNKNYKSIAIWPKKSGIVDNCGENKSIDFHETSSQAESVCNLLEKEGYGGEGKFFPMFTRVEKIR